MQLEIARNFAEIRNEKHQEGISQLAGIGEQITQSLAVHSSTGSLTAQQDFVPQYKWFESISLQR